MNSIAKSVLGNRVEEVLKLIYSILRNKQGSNKT